MKRSIFVVICLIFITPFFVGAQTQSLSSTGLQLIASNNYPAPGQKITITASSYSADVNTSQITWRVDDKVVQNGVGLTTLTVVAPGLGKKLNIEVSAATVTGRIMTTSITVGSGLIDLITETDGYTPPLFKGKVPVFYQNSIKIIAMPHLVDSRGREYDPKTLEYRWERNNQVLQDQSGYGKQTLTIKGDLIPREYELMLTVWSKDNGSQAKIMTTISYNDTSIKFYKNDPLYGKLFNNALGDQIYIGSQQEMGIVAVPFGFNRPQNSLGKLSMDWTINNSSHPELNNNDSVVLRTPDSSSGTSIVSLVIKNTNEILQSANASFSAIFSATSTSSKSITF